MKQFSNACTIIGEFPPPKGRHSYGLTPMDRSNEETISFRDLVRALLIQIQALKGSYNIHQKKVCITGCGVFVS